MPFYSDLERQKIADKIKVDDVNYTAFLKAQNIGGKYKKLVKSISIDYNKDKDYFSIKLNQIGINLGNISSFSEIDYTTDRTTHMEYYLSKDADNIFSLRNSSFSSIGLFEDKFLVFALFIKINNEMFPINKEYLGDILLSTYPAKLNIKYIESNLCFPYHFHFEDILAIRVTYYILQKLSNIHSYEDNFYPYTRDEVFWYNSESFYALNKIIYGIG